MITTTTIIINIIIVPLKEMWCCYEGEMNAGQSQITDSKYTILNHFLYMCIPIFNACLNKNNYL